ncbi:energy transducer TonB [Sphaerotilus sp.]|uniref:energy transducer TonB n=1 Tax=Sphaerotilus sp. TaxID=2093942 RepID=UPI0034E26715
MAQRRTLLAGCVTGSVLLHLGVLLCAPAAVPMQAGGTRGSSGRLGVAVRLETPHRPVSTATVVRDQTQRMANRKAPPPPAQPPWDPEQLPPTSAGPVASTGEDDPDAGYMPSRWLTRSPAPQQSIDLFYPELAPSGHFRAVLTLFIDAQGVVQRVRIDEAGDSGLPPVLEDSARQTFLRSAFVPGDLDGHPMRSQLRIEIEFATEPAGEHTQTASR